MIGSYWITRLDKHTARHLPGLILHWLTLASLVTVISLFFSGCASISRPPGFQKQEFKLLPLKYRHKALADEKKGQLRQALLSWRIVQSFSPADKNIAARISSLTKETQARAAAHFNKGVNFYHKGAIRAARREFLETLIYQPEHTGALGYLLEKLQTPVFKMYKTKAGDTAREIAAKVYHDPAKEFLITDFNRISNGRQKLPGGMPLRLVILGNNFLGNTLVVKGTARRKATNRPRHKAKVNWPANGKRIARQKGRPDIGGKTADIRRNYKRYRKAKELLEREEFLAALKLLRTIDSNYRDVPKLIAFSKVYLRQEAYAHYQKGVRYYLAEKLKPAIQEWQAALRLKPDYLKAKQDLRHAKELLRQLRQY